MPTKCTSCGSDLENDLMPRCPVCGVERYSNIHHAQRPPEVQALNRRYRETIATAKAEGRSESLADFERAVSESVAVINVTPLFLRRFFNQDSALYKDYGSLVNAEIRLPAPERDHQRRTITEALLFPTYEGRIVYAALSLDGSGLISYGSCAMRLKPEALAGRTTVMEENSFLITARPEYQNAFLSDKIPYPTGHRAIWEERHNLAVAKLGASIRPNMTRDDHTALVLSSTGNRAEDKFIEVHIFGSFSQRAIAGIRVSGSTTSRAEDRLDLKIARERAMNIDVSWDEA